MRCEAYPPKPTKTFAEFMSAAVSTERCKNDAAWLDKTSGRKVCNDCAERLVEASMSDHTVMGIYLRHHGKRPPTKEEARKRYLQILPS